MQCIQCNAYNALYYHSINVITLAELLTYISIKIVLQFTELVVLEDRENLELLLHLSIKDVVSSLALRLVSFVQSLLISSIFLVPISYFK